MANIRKNFSLALVFPQIAIIPHLVKINGAALNGAVVTLPRLCIIDSGSRAILISGTYCQGTAVI